MCIIEQNLTILLYLKLTFSFLNLDIYQVVEESILDAVFLVWIVGLQYQNYILK